MSTRIFKKKETGTAVANILAGTDFEYPTGMSQVVIASAGIDATASMTVKFGSRVIAEDLVISQELFRQADGALKLRKNGQWAWPPLLFDNPVAKVKSFLDVMVARR